MLRSTTQTMMKRLRSNLTENYRLPTDEEVGAKCGTAAGIGAGIGGTLMYYNYDPNYGRMFPIERMTATILTAGFGARFVSIWTGCADLSHRGFSAAVSRFCMASAGSIFALSIGIFALNAYSKNKKDVGGFSLQNRTQDTLRR